MLDLSPTLSKKGILEKRLLWSLRPRFEMGIEEGYRHYSPSNRLGVSRWFGGIWNVGLSHNLRYVDFFALAPSLDLNSTQLGRDFQDPFLLSYLELRSDIFLVDSISQPKRGAVFEATWDVAGGPLQGDYGFQKLLLGTRLYWPAAKRLQLAAHLQGGVILPFGAQAGAPFNFKFYLGGANSVRGWGSKRLSPRLEECAAEDPTDCDSIPVGGFTMLAGTLELRLALGAGFSLVGFADMGDVQADELAVEPAEWNYSAGPGLRFDSPVGLFRLDFGYRLNDPGLYPDEPRWAIYFGLGETF